MDRIRAARVFVAIVDLGSLSAAARGLDMSRSMVTRYLEEMEGWAEARLLHRSTRRIGLTSTGERVLEHCRQLLALADQVETASLAEEGEIKGSLRISCPQSLGQDVLVSFFRDFLERYPAVKVDLHVSDEPVNLVEERIDLAIRITNHLDPNLIARKLGECPSIVCAAPAYLKRCGRPLSIEDLGRHNCLTYARFGKSLWNFYLADEPVSVAVAGSLSADDSSILMRAAREGLGITMQPDYAVKPLIDRGELVQLLPDYVPQGMGIYGLYSSRKYMARPLRVLIDSLVERLSSQAP
ncbi:LysR family transcriptional regulator [Hahella ganghwensis]|uniref:LysR family transcriptional regulator n=1 Tax=Hahella ganghwensis TaxID=286420 RepID=UPI000375FFCD|nr:LysR family transcriptional regulator [Hahella ganghwensis]